MTVAVLGGGAFGTALSIALAREGQPVTLWSRDREDAEQMRLTRRSGRRLSGHDLPDSLTIVDAVPDADVLLIAIPAQQQRQFLLENAARFKNRTVISCAKGIERDTGLGPADVISDVVRGARAGILTGPSFAADIARGLPTALVLAMREGAEAVQTELTRPALRIYRTSDVVGAQLGGALKNVIAIAAGIAIGAGLGDSARASVVARGFAEMMRFAVAKGAETETIQGLSGLGDLVLTCTSEKSRNFSAGMALGRGDRPEEGTVEGLVTAGALDREAESLRLDLPLTRAVARVIDGTLDIPGAIATLLARPVGKE